MAGKSSSVRSPVRSRTLNNSMERIKITFSFYKKNGVFWRQGSFRNRKAHSQECWPEMMRKESGSNMSWLFSKCFLCAKQWVFSSCISMMQQPCKFLTYFMQAHLGWVHWHGQGHAEKCQSESHTPGKFDFWLCPSICLILPLKTISVSLSPGNRGRTLRIKRRRIILGSGSLKQAMGSWLGLL